MIIKFLHTLKYNYEVYVLRRRVPTVREVELEVETANTSARVYSYHDVICCGESGFVFDRSGKLYPASVPVEAKSKIRRPISWLAKKSHYKKVFHAAGECSDNRAHFMLEHGVRLMIGQRDGRLSQCDALLVHQHEAKWLDDYLLFFGVEKMPRVHTEKFSLSIDEVDFVPGASGDLLRFKREIYAEYGEFLRGKVSQILGEIEPGAEVVWISRKDAPERSCVNVAELQAVFMNVLGKEIEEVTLSEMSLQEQVHTLSAAKIIVAEEGQALNLLPFITDKNVIILDKGTHANQGRWNRGFQQMGEAVGNCVYCLFNDLDSNTVKWNYDAAKFESDVVQIKDLLV